MKTTPFAGGKLSPKNVARGVIVCDCGFTGEPLEVKRWAEFGLYLGLCPCGSSRAVQPRKRRAEA